MRGQIQPSQTLTQGVLQERYCQARDDPWEPWASQTIQPWLMGFSVLPNEIHRLQDVLANGEQFDSMTLHTSHPRTSPSSFGVY
jgi:hypothetical protein